MSERLTDWDVAQIATFGNKESPEYKLAIEVQRLRRKLTVALEALERINAIDTLIQREEGKGRHIEAWAVDVDDIRSAAAACDEIRKRPGNRVLCPLCEDSHRRDRPKIVDVEGRVWHWNCAVKSLAELHPDHPVESPTDL